MSFLPFLASNAGRLVCLASLLTCPVTSLMAEDQCPPGGSEKHASNESLTWSSIASETVQGICLERSVQTRRSGARLFIDWPVAGIEKLWIKDQLKVTACCFSEKSLDQGLLEYGLESKKVGTSVYKGFGEASKDEKHAYIRGTVADGDRDYHLAIVLTSEGIAFDGPQGFGYKYTVQVESLEGVSADWDLIYKTKQVRAETSTLKDPKRHMTTVFTKFISAEPPVIGVGDLVVHTRDGKALRKISIAGVTTQ
jgi:hypothetical protein